MKINKMLRIYALILSIILIGLLQGCENSDINDEDCSLHASNVADSDKTDINFTVIHSSQIGNYSPRNKTLRLIQFQSEYESELLKQGNEQPLDINFSSHSVVLVDIGTRSNTSYNVEVPSIYEDTNGDVHVKVVSKEPRGIYTAGDAMTNPYIFVKIPKTNMVYFDDTLEYYNFKDPQDTCISNTSKMENVDFKILEARDANAVLTTYGKVMKVITSEEEYATDVTKYTSKWYGTIDFERFDLVMITEGYHSQRNYSIEIQSVYKDVKNNVHVKVVYRTGYGDSCTFSSSLVNQDIVIQIPKNSRVYFDDSVEYYSCDE